MTEPSSPETHSSASRAAGSEATSSASSAASAGSQTNLALNTGNPAPAPDAGGSKSDGKGSSLWPWLFGIATILCIELYIYGHNGWVRVCVGIEGATQFDLLDHPRERGPARGYPICAEQLNLGMYSKSEDAAKESLDVACTRGATLMHGNKQDCLRRDHGWTRRVDKEQIPPWDPRLYRRLLFLD